MTNWAIWGTLVNAAAVAVGALVGMLIKKLGGLQKTAGQNENALDDTRTVRQKRISDTVMVGLGLCVLLIGTSGALKMQNVLVGIVSMALGGLMGEALDLDRLLNRFGVWVEKRVGGHGEGSIAQGFVTATLLFCVGAMTVTGAIESSVHHTHSTYYAKAMIDMVAAVIFGSAYGLGVVLSAGAVFVTQGALTLLASLLAGAIPMAIINEMIAVGSLLLVAIGLNQMGVTRIRVMNLLPAMFLPILLVPLFGLLPA